MENGNGKSDSRHVGAGVTAVVRRRQRPVTRCVAANAAFGCDTRQGANPRTLGRLVRAVLAVLREQLRDRRDRWCRHRNHQLRRRRAVLDRTVHVSMESLHRQSCRSLRPSCLGNKRLP